MTTRNQGSLGARWLSLALIAGAVALPLALVAQIGGGPIMPSTVGTFYADTGWNGTHGNPHNDDFANIDIARRTVTKYREAMNILSSTKRRQVG